jgi:hypothetical protein
MARRVVLQRGLGLVTGPVVAWLVPTGVCGQAAKLAKAAVSYVDVGTAPGKDCDDCVQFVPGADAKAMGTCRIVDGPISPHGHCIAFTPKAGKTSSAAPREPEPRSVAQVAQVPQNVR